MVLTGALPCLLPHMTVATAPPGESSGAIVYRAVTVDPDISNGSDLRGAPAPALTVSRSANSTSCPLSQPRSDPDNGTDVGRFCGDVNGKSLGVSSSSDVFNARSLLLK